jgi:hypothetical protein
MDAAAYIWEHARVIQRAVNACLEWARLWIGNCEMMLESQGTDFLEQGV